MQQHNGKKETIAVPSMGSGKVIATYMGGMVTEDEFYKYTGFLGLMDQESTTALQNAQYKVRILKRYIGFLVLSSRLGKLSDEVMKKIDAHVNSCCEYLKTVADSDTALNKQIEKANLSDLDIKYFYRLIRTAGDAVVNKITDDTVKVIFEETKADYNIVTMRHILIATTDLSTGQELRTEEAALNRTKEVKKKLEASGNWTGLAKEYSDDPGSTDSGGLYEGQTVGSYIAELKDAANKQEIGKIGDLVKTSFGYHVIKVEKREEMTFDKLTESQQAEIKQIIASEVMEKFMSEELEDLITTIDLPKNTNE